MGQDLRTVLDSSDQPHQGTGGTEGGRTGCAEGRRFRRVAPVSGHASIHSSSPRGLVMVTAAQATEHPFQTLNIVKQELIAATPEIVFETILENLGPGSEMPDGTPFPMKIEPWPG